ncbi:Cleavage and polyadenylation specificity factor subunit 4 [Nosema bombycis CQ1]|uniref:mRNA 3'-end-processing protein n=1 Tax=Nosema bombycis (strain CQ1 / CVCC 102059) TaxID=578461 RepID=R0KW57_NOSB1|nr:Cleavage and polyadenylation specificity factor subunit 4 [Nosema bombycis CQ1]|eukprot:EOB14422.1 Cleavage and polyadenylation specificity factor subunit 4 [Nosema bombycis CQ1]
MSSSSSDSLHFDFEDYVQNVLGLKEEEDIYCMPFQTNSCFDPNCDKQHIKLSNAVICKHWLRGLCKKGKKCEFIHEYDLKKMPQCFFYSKFWECTNPECIYLHVNPDKKTKECLWYNRGFCKHGANCKNKHVRRKMCYNYYLGFCLKGPECEYGHPKADIPKKNVIEI